MLEWTGAHVSTHIAGQLAGKARLQGRIRHRRQLPAVLRPCRRLAQRLGRGLAEQCRRHLSEGAGREEDRGHRQARSRRRAKAGSIRNSWRQVCPGLPDWTALQQARMRAGAVDARDRAQWPLPRLSGRLGFTRGDHHCRQQHALHRRAGRLGRRAGRRARIRRRPPRRRWS